MESVYGDLIRLEPVQFFIPMEVLIFKTSAVRIIHLPSEVFIRKGSFMNIQIICKLMFYFFKYGINSTCRAHVWTSSMNLKVLRVHA